jgi:molecular chaperone GrpE
MTSRNHADLNDEGLDDRLDRQPASGETTDDDSESALGESTGRIDADDEIQQLNDRLLRLQAEMENVRKRAAREVDDARRFAAAPLMQDLMSVVDNVQRAVAAAKDATDVKSLVDGFQLVAAQLQDVLANHACTKIEALGQPFDPHLHEAIGQQPSPTEPPGTVLMVVQDGYQLRERVLRPTRVIIAAPPAE